MHYGSKHLSGSPAGAVVGRNVYVLMYARRLKKQGRIHEEYVRIRYAHCARVNVGSPDLVFPDKPSLLSCLMCVSCHPLSPAIIAAGSFNGEVSIVNVDENATPSSNNTAQEKS